MYHDQVLTPIKTLFNFNAINITIGLPFIRISPDHGLTQVCLEKIYQIHLRFLCNEFDK